MPFKSHSWSCGMGFFLSHLNLSVGFSKIFIFKEGERENYEVNGILI
jgi:hypothetical protein